MFSRNLIRLCQKPAQQRTGRIQPIGVNLNQQVKKKLEHLEILEKIKKDRQSRKNNRANEDPIIKKVYAELEEEGFFEGKNREDY
ncbi:hypothetical protein DICPUDRAFT_150660 [Dictyostelium purpureum]|uniref:Uncharacterized protein n=1 Tax=Dictyostelium purpureum TaxID=5786 RepID=F0ZGX2_DICPU|nr:uncharacterized protein DICPUDRAFT_150660 [Dictyostelium purpureum]EGC36787.1 hypothetical protein DICPUDRAFT_150660 [Dictyostelium purpureum]|eukprot:XP_003286658.1 hypothetical protein DICPUDRAFT_150660 [Dictyostelium purpureum]